MSDFKTLENKINHVDKTVTGIDTTIKHLTDKLTETVRHNATALENHDTRINSLERSFHVYDGSIKTLNRLLTLCGAGIISGIVWLFMQITEIKRDNALLQSNYQHLALEINELRHNSGMSKYDRTVKSTDTNQHD